MKDISDLLRLFAMQVRLFWLCLFVLLVVLLSNSNAMSKSVAIKTEANCGLPLPPSNQFFAGIYGTYSRMA